MANKIKLYAGDIAPLFYNLARARYDPEVGFEDAVKTYPKLLASLDFQVSFNIADIESALWASNMLHEQKKFLHPEGLTFKNYLIQLLQGSGYKFNSDYNTLERRYDK